MREVSLAVAAIVSGRGGSGRARGPVRVPLTGAPRGFWEKNLLALAAAIALLLLYTKRLAVELT